MALKKRIDIETGAEIIIRRTVREFESEYEFKYETETKVFYIKRQRQMNIWKD